MSSRSQNTPVVIAFGEVLWDRLPTGDVLGGAPANFSYQLHSLGTSVSLVSRIGRDELGSNAKRFLQSKRFDLSLLQEDEEYPTGTVDVTLDSSGNPSYVINPGVAYDHIQLSTDLSDKVAACDYIYFGSLIQRSNVSRNALYSLLKNAKTVIKLLDVNLRSNCFTPETVRTSLEFADIVKLNNHEVKNITELLGLDCDSVEGFCELLRDRFQVNTCLVTRGDQGVIAFSKSGKIANVPGYIVPVTDTIGAGDAFTAGFVHAHAQGKSLLECCQLGNRLGALTASKSGGMPDISIDEIEADSFPIQSTRKVVNAS